MDQYTITTYCNKKDGLLFITNANNRKEALNKFVNKCKREICNEFRLHKVNKKFIMSNIDWGLITNIYKVKDAHFVSISNTTN